MRTPRPALVVVALLVAAAAPHAARAQSVTVVPRFEIPASPLALEGPARPGVYLAETGSRAALFGDEAGRFEAWTWPLKLVRDLQLAFRIPEYDEPIEAAQVARRVIHRPEGQTIVYSHATFTVRMHLIAPLDEPGILMLLDVETVRPLEILVRMHADFNLAWPGGFGGANIGWQDEEKAFLLTQGGVRLYNAAIGSPAATSGTSHPAHDAPLVGSQFTIRVDTAQARRGFIPVVIAGGAMPRDSMWTVYRRLLDNAPRYWPEKAAHFARVRDSLVTISSPDPALDRAFEWAKVNLDRQRVCNPDLGCGLVAGFGRAGAGNFRPGFGWYFGGDAAINSLAMDVIGQFDLVREGLDFSARYQRADGKIAHEISHAAKRLPWFDQYPYTWYHGDTTPFWILAVAEYWKASGDSAFVRAHWDNLVRAFRWSRATDTDGDGLMENPTAGAGAIEVGGLGDDLWSDIYLAGVWVSALEGLGRMAGAMGDGGLAAEVRTLHEKAAASLERRFWLPDQGRYAFALLGDPKGGVRLNDALTVWPTTAMSFGQLDLTHSRLMLRQVASAALTTDWGVRPLSSAHPLYEPLHYNNGAVWPFVTGFAAMAQYRGGRGWNGFELLQAVARTTFDFARGHNPELISGAFYEPLDTAVPDQFFATSMLASPLLRGLLGFAPDAPRCQGTLAPQLPPEWRRFEARNLGLGCARVTLKLEQEPGRIRATLTASPGRGSGTPQMQLRLELPLGSRLGSVMLDGKAIPGETRDDRYGPEVRVSVSLPGTAPVSVEVHYTGGAALAASSHRPAIGSPSEGLRILDWSLADGRYLLDVEGVAGKAYTMGVVSDRPFSEVLGARLTGRSSEGVTALEFRIPGDGGEYRLHRITLTPAAR